MPLRFAINGLGRIGRALLRVAHSRPELELVAVNDLGSADQLARLLARDSVHGPFDAQVESHVGALIINERRITVFNRAELADIPWPEVGPAIVVDATGICLTRESALQHLRSPVRKVLVSANAEWLDATICVGVNEEIYDPGSHHLLSAASCTTNALAPVAAVLHRTFGVRRAFLNTVHSYNNDQRLLGAPHQDPRRARAAALNMIPTTTSAIQALSRVLPELEGRIEGFAVRVPTPNVSLIDLVAELDKPASIEQINQTFREASRGPLTDILAVTEEKLVSTDFIGSPYSATIDLPLTQSLGGTLIRVVAWYDNEWGHASRLADLLALVGRNL